MRARLALLLALFAFPAYAEDPAASERTQETIPVGDSRFLIFVGAPDDGQIGYTVDLIKVDDGTPYYIPLFMEEYNHDTNTAQLSYGVAFEAVSYHYNKTEHTLDIRSIAPETKTRLDLHYTLDDDILHLQSVMSQPETCKKDCKAKQIYTKKS